MITLKQVREGSIIVVRGGFGNGSPKRAKVVETSKDIKNGRAGIEYTEIQSGEDCWAYLDQIVTVEKF